jgi:type II secretory pathway pseudopilin PulG
MSMHGNIAGASTARGFTLLGVIFIAAIVAIAAAATISAGQVMQRHAAEQDLLFVGLQYKQAFRSYYEAAVSAPRYPLKLEDLLKDPRFPGIRRHLRRLYADPLSGKPEWGTIPAPGGGIMGVYSLAKGTPIKIALFDPEVADFEGKTSYADWQFAYVAPGMLGPDGKPLTNVTTSNTNTSATTLPSGLSSPAIH